MKVKSIYVTKITRIINISKRLYVIKIKIIIIMLQNANFIAKYLSFTKTLKLIIL
jgi:hypothetical protein